ncbi:MAG: hypothetical protein M5U17_09245 [Ignavibacterium sp.]|nr:hypothetical protein [Ignavibacterium sp.]
MRVTLMNVALGMVLVVLVQAVVELMLRSVGVMAIHHINFLI